jgi:hypothetical protein
MGLPINPFQLSPRRNALTRLFASAENGLPSQRNQMILLHAEIRYRTQRFRRTSAKAFSSAPDGTANLWIYNLKYVTYRAAMMRLQ